MQWIFCSFPLHFLEKHGAPELAEQARRLQGQKHHLGNLLAPATEELLVRVKKSSQQAQDFLPENVDTLRH